MRRRLVAALIALACAAPAAADTHRAQFLQKVTWPREAHGLGGFSAIELSQNGTRFVAISDDGVMLYGSVIRKDGRITALGPDRRRRLVPGPQPDPAKLDAEGIATAADGSFYISFERDHRIERFGPRGPGQPLPRGAAFDKLEENGGFEALTIDAQGRLLTLPERSGRITQDFPLWRFDGRWSRIAWVPRRASFLPVGADMGPDGRLYLLERAFPGFGFRSQVRSFALTPQGLSDERLHLKTPVWQYDNLEGLSVWRDEAGQIRLTMISDDNFNAFQSTQIVEYALPLASAQANR